MALKDESPNVELARVVAAAPVRGDPRRALSVAPLSRELTDDVAAMLADIPAHRWHSILRMLLCRGYAPGASENAVRLWRALGDAPLGEPFSLPNARLAGAHLDGAVLTGANLHGARLTEASRVGARLDGADLGEADLTGACGIEWRRRRVCGVLGMARPQRCERQSRLGGPARMRWSGGRTCLMFYSSTHRCMTPPS